MKLKLERSGGLAGTPLVVEIDLDRLPHAEAERLKRLVDAADLFSLEDILKAPAVEPPPGAGPQQVDRFVYRIRLEHEGRVKAIEMDEEAVPASCHPLIQYLVKAAKRSG